MMNMLYHSKGRQYSACYMTTDSGPPFPIDGRARKRERDKTTTNVHEMERNKLEQTR